MREFNARHGRGDCSTGANNSVEVHVDPRRLARIPSGSRAHSILIVDDDGGVRKLLTDWVDVLGHESHVAENAETALETARTQHIDVALIDIMLPGRSGVWLISEIQRHCPHIAMIIVTGLTAMDPSVTLSPGVIAYIVKPFTFETVKGRIGEAIRSRVTVRDASRIVSGPSTHVVPLRHPAPF
jgi:DNA-binding NtrC family response regulator